MTDNMKVKLMDDEEMTFVSFKSMHSLLREIEEARNKNAFVNLGSIVVSASQIKYVKSI